MRRITYLLLSALIILETAFAGEIFVSTRDSLYFADNLTLVVLDVNPGSGVVWVELRDEKGILESSLLRVGKNFAYGERVEGEEMLNLTVTRIYAGGEMDLVGFEVNSGDLVENANGNGSGNGPEQPDRSKAIPASLKVTILVALLALLAFRRHRGTRTSA